MLCVFGWNDVKPVTFLGEGRSQEENFMKIKTISDGKTLSVNKYDLFHFEEETSKFESEENFQTLCLKFSRKLKSLVMRNVIPAMGPALNPAQDLKPVQIARVKEKFARFIKPCLVQWCRSSPVQVVMGEVKL